MGRRFIADRLLSDERDLSNEAAQGVDRAVPQDAAGPSASPLSYRRISISPIEPPRVVGYRFMTFWPRNGGLMDIRRIRQLGTGIAAIGLVVGCSTWDDMNQTERGTAVGSASGHAVGFVAGGPVGSVVGGAVGAAAGHQAAKANSNGGAAQTAGGIDDAMLVLLAQQSLKEKGYDAGKPDGRWGPKTEEALRSFQSANGIDATGQLDYPTMVALGITPAANSTATQ